MLNDKFSSAILATGIAIGIIGGATILGRSIQESRTAERYVTVRGVAEQEAKADLVVWPIIVRAAGDNLNEANRAADDARKKVLAFLEENGIQASDIASQNIRVSDRQATDYVSAQVKQALRYIVVYTILVRSKAVDRVKQVSQLTDKLVAAGVILSSTNPQFLFTQLNAIKPAMLADATRAAREAASKFAADSGSKVGSIRRASQGLFSISDRDQAPRLGDSGEPGGSSSSDLAKTVRVVVTIDYVLSQ